MQKERSKQNKFLLITAVIIFTSVNLFSFAQSDTKDTASWNIFTQVYCNINKVVKIGKDCVTENSSSSILTEVKLGTQNESLTPVAVKQISTSSQSEIGVTKKINSNSSQSQNAPSKNITKNNTAQLTDNSNLENKINFLQSQIDSLKNIYSNISNPSSQTSYSQPASYQFVFTGSDTSNNNSSASINTNSITSSANSIQSFVNGLASNIVNIINSFSSSVSGNTLTTNINGVSATTSIITNNNVNYSGGILTTNVNGIIATTSITGLVSTTTNSLSSSNNSLISSVNGVSATTTIININSASSTGNVLNTNVNGIISTTTLINSNTASSSGNVFQTIVNGVISNVANIINTFTQSVAGNTLSTTINGITSTTSIITNNSLSSSGSILTSNVNGIIANLDLANAISSSTNNSLSSSGNILTSLINGKSANTNIINSNVASTSLNSFENIINGISSGVKQFINSLAINVSGNTLTENINGVTATTSVINTNTASSSGNVFQTIVNGVASNGANIINSFTQNSSNNILTSVVNGVSATSSIISSNSLSYSTSTNTLTTSINGVIATTSIQTTGNYLPTTGGTMTGNINMSASIIPTQDNTYSLGSATSTWKDVYVGPGSLYVNGQEVVSTDVSSNVVVSADVNQSVVIKTYGTGDIELNPSGGGVLSLKGNINLSGGKTFKTSNDTPFLFAEDMNPYYNNVFNLGSSSATWHYAYANKFITTGGTSSQFVKGDGSLDNNSYYLASNPSNFITTAALSATGPLTYTNGVFGISQANSSQNGYLTYSDWNNFNNKQGQLTFSGSLINTSNNVSLVGDSANPGTNMYYGTNGSGTKGFYNIPSAGTWGQINGTLTNQTDLISYLSTNYQTKITTGTSSQYIKGDLSLGTFPTTLSSFTNDSGFISNLSSFTTSNLVEGTNLYFTNARAQNAISLTTTGNSGSATYSTTTGVFNIPTYTLSGLGGQASSSNLTSLSNLSYSSNGFVKMTGANTFTVDTNNYALSSSLSNYLPLGGGTTTGDINMGGEILSLQQIIHLLSAQHQAHGKIFILDPEEYI